MNAKKELIDTLYGQKMKCALINYLKNQIVLKVGHNDADLELFMDQLNFEYNNRYGRQELFGIVWLENGTWIERGEYDGSEWWEVREMPPIPDLCK